MDSYCSALRYAARWRQEIEAAPGDGGVADVPLMFQPSEPFQFDCNPGDVESADRPMSLAAWPF